MEPTKENIAKLGTIDVPRKVNVIVKFFRVNEKTQEKEEIEADEIATKVAEYIGDQMTEERVADANNNIRRKIIPLMSSVMASASVQLVGPHMAYFLLHQQMLRTHSTFMMATAYTLNQFMRKHNLSIEVTEIPMTDVEVELAVAQSKENDIKAISQLTGIPEETLRRAWSEHDSTKGDKPSGKKEDLN